jgi:hypothetical protein
MATEKLESHVVVGTKDGIANLVDFNGFWLPLFQKARRQFTQKHKPDQIKNSLDNLKSYIPVKRKLEFIGGTYKDGISLPSLLDDWAEEHAQTLNLLHHYKQKYGDVENAAPPTVAVVVPPQHLVAPSQQRILRTDVRIAIIIFISSTND